MSLTDVLVDAHQVEAPAKDPFGGTEVDEDVGPVGTRRPACATRLDRITVWTTAGPGVTGTRDGSQE